MSFADDSNNNSNIHNDWCTIESDPGVFTELLENVGVKGVELEELWSLDDDALAQLGDDDDNPLYGLVFLFKWEPGQDTSLRSSSYSSRTLLSYEDTPPDLFFAKQVTTNACATQAILSIVLNSCTDNNNNNNGIELGPMLTEFKNFVSSFPPELKGEAIGASTDLQQAHNAFARKDAFLNEGRDYSNRRFLKDEDMEDVFHFVAYVPHKPTKKVYELDGLQSGPIEIGNYHDDENDKDMTDTDTTTSTTADKKWYIVARDAIQERMNATPNNVKFNLMAVVGDRRRALLLRQQMASDGTSNTNSGWEAELAHQEAKRHQWKIENQRRRHNYVPLCIALLKEFARKGTLPELVNQAGERMRTKKRQKKT